MVELKDTAKMMTSEDYKNRFKAEYYQLDTRIQLLERMLIKWDNEQLPFEPTYPRYTYDLQLEYMRKYRAILVMRAKIENVDL